MGRIKTKQVKAVTKKLWKDKKDLFTTDYKKNKEILEQHTKIYSKKIKNIIAGYITKLKKINTI